jgi:hypothetical protein
MSRPGSIVIGILVVALVLAPVALHYGQKRHDQLAMELPRPSTPDAPRGAAFATAAAGIMTGELDGLTGWRPNDLPPWGPQVGPDNNASRQLGILQALRETTRVFKDHLTKVSSDEYDPNLVQADNLLRNDPEKWAFPSAESRYERAVERLHEYAQGLQSQPPKSRPINVRNVELIRLVQAWTDLLGAAHANLFGSHVGWFQLDDVFYQASGTCHVIAHMIPAIQLEYARELQSRAVLAQLLDEAQVPLGRCATMKPIVVLNGSDTSVLANHRRNLDAYVTEARQKLYSVREELEK